MNNLPYDKDEMGFCFRLKNAIEWDQSTKSLEVIFDELRLVDVSKKYRKEFKQKTPEPEFVLSNFFDDNEPFAKACLEKALDEEKVQIQFSEKKGEDIYNYYLGTYQIEKEEKRKVSGFFGIIKEISIDQYYERKLRNLSDELNKKIKELQNINFTTSHKIRSPLARIMGLIEIMKLEGKYDSYMEMLESSCKELDREIRRFTRIVEEEKTLNRDSESGS